MEMAQLILNNPRNQSKNLKFNKEDCFILIKGII